MKIGVNIRIDVTKLLKERFYKGGKGTYCDLTTFIDIDNKDQYENNGFISQSVDKAEKDQGVQTPILGNCKVFYKEQGASGGQPQQRPQTSNQPDPRQQQPVDDFSDSIPF